jgi:hypothetical protein
VNGEIHSVHLDYAAGTAAGADVTLSESGGSGRTFLTVTNSNTDAARILYNQVSGADGAAITGVYTHPAIAGRSLVVTIADGGATVANAVIATIFIKV